MSLRRLNTVLVVFLSVVILLVARPARGVVRSYVRRVS